MIRSVGLGGGGWWDTVVWSAEPLYVSGSQIVSTIDNNNSSQYTYDGYMLVAIKENGGGAVCVRWAGRCGEVGGLGGGDGDRLGDRKEGDSKDQEGEEFYRTILG